MKAADDRLYRILENRICERIFRGDYADGENLPAERVLAQSLGVSRVTVRKALGTLEAHGIIERAQGSGNRVSLSVAGYPGTTDIIAVLARAQNVFFSTFIDHFQRTAEGGDSLVLLKQIACGERFEESLFKLLQKNIRNAVIWLEDRQVDMELIRRLRGLGMNMVFFDAVTPSPYADGVLLDNKDAIATLLRAVDGPGAVAYVGWAGDAILSAGERESVFVRQQAAASAIAPVYRIPWHARGDLARIAGQIVDAIDSSAERPAAILCGDGEIGVAIRKALNLRGLERIEVASPDEYPESLALSISVYRQDFEKMAATTFACLVAQNQPGWKASVYRVKGELRSARCAI